MLTIIIRLLQYRHKWPLKAAWFNSARIIALTRYNKSHHSS